MYLVDWFLLRGLLGQARLARTSESQISSRQQNERMERSTKSFGMPSAFVWSLHRSCPTEGNTGTEQLRRCGSERTYDDAQLSQPHTYMHLLPYFIEVTSATLRAHLKQALATAWQQGHGVSYLCTQQHQRRPAEADQYSQRLAACRTGICHGEVRPLSQKQLLLRLGPQPNHKMWAAVTNK